MSTAPATPENIIVATKPLIKPANEKERMLERINNMQQEYLKIQQIAAEKKRIDELKDMVKNRFEYLTERYFKISRAQIRKLPNQELEVLSALTYERAEKIMAKAKRLRRMLFFSVIGWPLLIFPGAWDEKLLLSTTRELQLIVGDKYSPVALMRDILYET